jgi:hypothetical protein
MLEKHRLLNCTKGQLLTNQNEQPGDYSFRISQRDFLSWKPKSL